MNADDVLVNSERDPPINELAEESEQLRVETKSDCEDPNEELECFETELDSYEID